MHTSTLILSHPPTHTHTHENCKGNRTMIFITILKIKLMLPDAKTAMT